MWTSRRLHVGSGSILLGFEDASVMMLSMVAGEASMKSFFLRSCWGVGVSWRDVWAEFARV